MGTLLSVHSLAYSVANRKLFDSVNFTLNQNDRVGLVGYNGSGKSTILRLLARHIQPDLGCIELNRSCLIRIVEQHLPSSLMALPLRECLLQALPTTRRQANEWQAEALLTHMGFLEEQFNLPIQALSGGFYTRLLLARAIIQDPDVLLLDEPSNHLDLTTQFWMESYLNQWRGSYILVSHDARLLDNLTNVTWILRDQRLHSFQLPYSLARAKLDAKDKSDLHRYQAEQKEITRIELSAKRLVSMPT